MGNEGLVGEHPSWKTYGSGSAKEQNLFRTVKKVEIANLIANIH